MTGKFKKVYISVTVNIFQKCWNEDRQPKSSDKRASQDEQLIVRKIEVIEEKRFKESWYW